MPGLNKRFQDRFNALMRQNKLNASTASRKMGFAVSSSTLRLWRDGMEPKPETLERFLSYFPEENPQEWLRLLDTERQQAA